MQFQQDLSSIPLQCIQTIAQEQGWGEHFQMFAVFLSTLTLPLHHYLLECRKGLLPVFLLDFKKNRTKCLQTLQITVKKLLSRKGDEMFDKGTLLAT